MESIVVNKNELEVKIWNNQRVVTFNDIDKVHSRPDGTSSRNYRANKDHFIKNEDYFFIVGDDLKKLKQTTKFVGSRTKEIMLLTESGYLMVVKSFTDDLAWDVQRQLVKSYFKLQDVALAASQSLPIDLRSVNETIENLQRNFSIVCEQVNSMENVLDYQLEQFKMVMENMTLSTRQQEKLLEAARKRVNYLLGGAHSERYKKMSRTYLINLWNGLKSSFNCGSSYKDLNPDCYIVAIDYIKNWTYDEK